MSELESIWTDSHCHFNFPDSFPDPAAAIELAASAGVNRFVVVGIDYESSARAVELANRFEPVFAVAGIHPTYAGGFREKDLIPFEELVRHPKCVALGEIGMDFHWDTVTEEDQVRALTAQLEWDAAKDLPVVLHIREAYPAIWPILENHAHNRQLDFHCFSGTDEDCTRGLQLNSWFGFDGPITFPKSVETRAIAARLPFDRILLETDSPYLSPVPFRGKPNDPSRIPLIGATVADLKSVPASECAKITSQNVLRAFPKMGEYLSSRSAK